MDEIGELPLLMQTKLLKVIQDGSLTRLGDTRSRKVNFRLVVATNQDLGKRVEAGLFRLDLYYRLNVIPVTLPPLRDRREDIPDLVEACLNRLNQRYGRQKILDTRVWSTLMGGEWPGNVRELENWLERAWLSSPTDQIEVPAALPHAEQHPANLPSASPARSAVALEPQETLKQYLARLERETLEELCNTLPSTYAIAKRLGISQSSVVRRLQRYGIKVAK